jgi:hypothetical protein
LGISIKTNKSVNIAEMIAIFISPGNNINASTVTKWNIAASTTENE